MENITKTAQTASSIQTTWWGKRYFTARGVDGYLQTYHDVLTPDISRHEALAALSAPTVTFGDPIPPQTPKLDGFCGTARHSKEAVEMGHKNWHAVDYSPVMLEKARHHLNGHAAHIQLSQQDAKNMSFSDGHFGYYQVLGNSALGLFGLEDDKAILREAARVLQSGGYFVFDNPNYKYVQDQLVDHTIITPDETGVVIKKRTTRSDDKGTIYTGHREYRLPQTHLPSSGIDVIEAKGMLLVTHNGNTIGKYQLQDLDIQDIYRTIYTPQQIFALMKEAGFDPAMVEQAFVYDAKSDKLGTMGVRDVFVGRKVA